MRKIEKLFLNDHFILILIFLNSAVIFIQGFNNIPGFVAYLDNIFTGLFTIEMLVKIHTYGFDTYWKNSWNKFDFILVTTALVALLIDLIDVGHTIPLQYILILRILRLFKSLRIFRFMPDINNIVKGLHNAIKASYVVTLAFIVFLVILSVLSCAIFKNLAPEYFDTPLESLYSMFRLFSTEGWYEIADLIASRSTPIIAIFTKVYFILLLFFAGILGLSLINSIFVDAMFTDSNERLEEKVNTLIEQLDILLKERNLKRTNKTEKKE